MTDAPVSARERSQSTPNKETSEDDRSVLQRQTDSGRRWSRRRGPLTPYLLIAPAVLLVAGVLLYPMVRTVFLSFQAWPFADPEAAQWVGLENYSTQIGDERFTTAFVFTIVFTVLALAVEFTIAMGAALVLDRLRRGRGLVMSIAVAPYMVAPIAVGLIWRLMLQRDVGVVNHFLGLVGVEPVNWLAETTPAIASTIAAEAWRSIPFVMLILLAGLTAIPDELREAALCDGAGRWGMFRRITLPLLSPYIAVALIFETVFKLRVFDLVVTLTRGGPVTDTTPLGLLVQRLFFRYFSGGEAAAVSVILLLIGTGVAIVYLRGVYREIEY